MGWDVWLAVRFQEKDDPVQRFVRVASQFASSKMYDEFIRLRAHTGVYHDNLLEDLYIGGNREPPISDKQICSDQEYW